MHDMFYNLWALACEMSPYLLLGFLLAGLLHVYVPRRALRRYLSGENVRSVFLSALCGVPLPLCSCGVIPTAMGLRREGASKGATVSFLIATPQTGVDSIIATYSLLGLPFAIARPVVAFLTALLGGTLAAKTTAAPELTSDTSVCRAETTPSEGGLLSALRYGFFTMMQDIGRWLVVGLVVAALITTLVPEGWFTLFASRPLLEMLLVLLFSIPMYLCATGSIPIAVALMLKGLSPGAALVLLMAGPATNAASLLVIHKVLGRRTLLVYLLSIVAGAIAAGAALDLLPRAWFTVAPLHSALCCGGPEWFKTASSVCLALLLINALVLPLFHRKPSAATLYIEGMHCNHCAEAVEEALRDVDGVERATVSLANKSALVEGKASRDALRKAVESVGFKIRDTHE